MLSLQPLACVVMWYSVGCKCRLHSKITTTTKYVIYLCRVRVRVVCCCRYMDDDLCAIFAPCAVFVSWYVWILFKCGYIRYMLNSLYSSFMFRYVILDLVYYFNRTLYKQCFIVYMADFLLVNIYTFVKRLRDRELRVVLVETWRIQHFLTYKYASYSNYIA